MAIRLYDCILVPVVHHLNCASYAYANTVEESQTPCMNEWLSRQGWRTTTAVPSITLLEEQGCMGQSGGSKYEIATKVSTKLL